MPLSDEHIMGLAAGGEHEQIGILFDRHHRRVFVHCYRMTGQASTADDLVQETFLRLLRYRQSWKGQARFTTWLFQIARNVCIDHLGKARRDREATHAAGEETPIRHEPRPLEQAESGALLEGALQRLADDKREIIVMSRYLDLSFPEIAKILGCTPGAARVRFHRAINELRRVYLKMEEA